MDSPGRTTETTSTKLRDIAALVIPVQPADKIAECEFDTAAEILMTKGREL
jgi:hypothetical protein